MLVVSEELARIAIVAAPDQRFQMTDNKKGGNFSEGVCHPKAIELAGFCVSDIIGQATQQLLN